VVLAVATFAGDVIAVIAGYDLAKTVLETNATTTTQIFRPIVFATVAIWPVVFAVFGLYNPRRLIHVSRAEFIRGGAAAVVATLLVLLVTFEAQTEPRRYFIPALLVCCLLTVSLGRVVTRLLAFAEW
jgi:glucan phosphoethanolaminetransferase (alkaline phosphatase superfamily)